MKLVHVQSGKYTKVKNGDFGLPDVSAAADRLVARVYGSRDYYAHRSVGWNYLPSEFIVHVYRCAGDLAERVDKCYLQIVEE